MISGLGIILIRDVKTFFTDFYGVGFRTINVFLETTIFAWILTRVVSPSSVGGLTYLQFFALGSLVVSTFWASYSVGRDIFWEIEEGFLSYLMSLPFPRRNIVIAKSLGGGLRAMFTAIPLYLLSFFLLDPSALDIAVSVGVLFLFAIGICGIGTIIGLSIRNEIKSRLVTVLVSLVLVRASTAFYPTSVMPQWLQITTRFDPVTYATDSIRSVMTGTYPGALIEGIPTLILFTATVGLIGSWLFSNVIQGGRAE